MEEMTEEEVRAKIAEHLKMAEDHLDIAGHLAKKYDVYLSWDGPAWGMGGSFNNEEDQWESSSSNC